MNYLYRFRGAAYQLTDFEEPYLYHVTYAKHLPSIIGLGLVPQGAGEDSGFSILSSDYAKGYVFLSEDGATPIWAEFLNMGASVQSGYIPVLLRIPLAELDLDLLEEDEIGSRDVPEGRAFRTKQIIPSARIQIWAPEGHFVPVHSVTPQEFIDRAAEVSDEAEDVLNLFVPYW